MRLKKLISDEINELTVQIVDNTYVLLETEEFVQSAVLAEIFYFYNRMTFTSFVSFVSFVSFETSGSL